MVKPSSTVDNQNRLLGLVVSAIANNAEISLTDLFGIIGIPETEPELGKVQLALEQVARLGLELVPGIEKGDLTSLRRLKHKDAAPAGTKNIVDEIRSGEGPRLEFKSSLLYDHKRASACPETPVNQLRSEAVLHSAMKTIAAFLNSGGGAVYIGIDDSGSPVGIQYDLLFLPERKRDTDNWQLLFRDLVKSNFRDGESINDYVDVRFELLQDRTIARIQVAGRKPLSFVKGKEGFVLYRRQGNRTAEVLIDQIEEFLQLRNESTTRKSDI